MEALDLFAQACTNWQIEDFEDVLDNLCSYRRTVTDTGTLEALKQVEVAWPTQVLADAAVSVDLTRQRRFLSAARSLAGSPSRKAAVDRRDQFDSRCLV